MPLAYKPDSDMAIRRHEAFWNRAILDRPPVNISLPMKDRPPRIAKTYKTLEEKWLDVDERVEALDDNLAHTCFLYDALPIAWPNLGPEIFSAMSGCPYRYGESTTWTEPLILDWQRDYDKARFDVNHPLFLKLMEFTDKLIERGRGKFIVGMTDLHPGGDHLAALRDPMELNIDMIENPDWVDYMLSRTMPEHYMLYGIFYNKLRQAGMPITTWLPTVHEGTYYVPSNDFSCMISNEMFVKHFLPGIEQECRFYERSMYHLDGPNALRHLDCLLDIPELDAVQWVFGAGNEGFARWRKVYQKIQAAGKGMWLVCDVKELDDVFASLRPEGVFFGYLSGVTDEETAEAAVRRIAKWK